MSAWYLTPGLTLAVFIAFGGNLLAFGRAMPRFAAPLGWSPQMRALTFCGAGVGALDLTMIVWRPATGRQVVAVTVAIASGLLFQRAIAVAHRHRFAVAFSEVPPTALVSEGPYQWLRHPLYVSYALNWAAAALAVAHWAPAAGAVLMWAFYAVAAVREDRALSSLRAGTGRAS